MPRKKKLEDRLGLKWGLVSTLIIACLSGYILLTEYAVPGDQMVEDVWSWLFKSSAVLLIGGLLALIIREVLS